MSARFTLQLADDGIRTIIRKDGEPVADVTPNAAGGGLWVHYFGPTKCSLKWPALVPDMDRARDMILLAGAE